MLPIPRRSYMAIEAIEMQIDSDFGWKLETEFAKIMNAIKSGEMVNGRQIESCPEIKTITALIKKHLNITVKINTRSYLGAVIPFYSNRNHVFLKEMWRGNELIKEQTAILREANKKTATFDKRTGRVGGIFAEYTHPLYINFKTMVDTYELTPGEATAVTLHEIGHIVHACEYTDRLETTNQVMADVAERVIFKKKDLDLKYVYTELQKVDKNISQDEVEKMCTGPRIIAGLTWFKHVVRAKGGGLRSQLNNDTYDVNAFEAMADNFATRYGYGKDLVSGLDKLHVAGGDPRKSETRIYVHQFFSMVYFYIQISAAIYTITAGIFGLSFIVGLFIFIDLYISANHVKDHTYDDLKDRYARVRAQYVEMLKDVHLDKEQTKTILDNIYMCDEVMKETYKYLTIYEFIANKLFGGARASISSIEEQQLVEQLANNDLFVQAARLRS